MSPGFPQETYGSRDGIMITKAIADLAGLADTAILIFVGLAGGPTQKIDIRKQLQDSHPQQ